MESKGGNGAAQKQSPAHALSATGIQSLGAVAGGRYHLKQKIGSGSFGEIHLGIDTRTATKVAVKLEALNSKYPQLEYEYRVYQSIQANEGLAQVHWYGHTNTHNVMVMDLLGETLENLYNRCKRHFSLKTVLMLAVQLLNRLEHHHNNNYLHRDIKPDNFLMGLDPGTQHLVYIIDMGLCKRYRDPKTREHIPFKENKKMIGTPRYASVNAHVGSEQSRRDDLESLGYLLVYFMAGELPWQGLQARTKQEKYDKISKKKSTTPIATLCKGMPKEFCTYLTYCRGLKFDQEPDYNYLRRLFYDLFRYNGFVDDFKYDWSPTDQKVARKFLPADPSSGAASSALPSASASASAAMPTKVTSAGGTVSTAGMPPGFTAVPISHIGAASIPGAILDEPNGRICLPPGYTFLPAYEVVLPPGALFDEATSSIRYEGRLYPILPPSHTPMSLQAAAAAQQMQQYQMQAEQTQQRHVQSQTQPVAQAPAPAQAQVLSQQQQQPAAKRTKSPKAATTNTTAAAPAMQRTTSNLSVQIPSSVSPAQGMEIGASSSASARPAVGNGSGSGSGSGGLAPMAVGGQTPVPMPTSSPLEVRAKTEPVTMRRPSTPPGVAPSNSAAAVSAMSAEAASRIKDERHKHEMEQWMEAYEQMEADRDKWRKKYDDQERLTAARGTRLEEYERLVQRLKQEINKLREHVDSCPTTAQAAPTTRKRKLASAQAATTKMASPSPRVRS